MAKTALVWKLKDWLEMSLVAAVVMGGLGTALWSLWEEPKVEACVVKAVADRPVIPKVDTLIHQHVDPLTDSLLKIQRETGEWQRYMTFVLDEMAGPVRAQRAQDRYLQDAKVRRSISR